MIYMRCPQCGSKNLKGSRFTTSKLHPGAQPIDDKGTYHYYSYVKTEDVMCLDCRLMDGADDDSPEFDAFYDRWGDPEMNKKETPEEREAWRREMDRMQEQREREKTWPEEPKIVWPTEWRAQQVAERSAEDKLQYPENPELLNAVVASPEDDAPRRAYAKWMAQQPKLGEWNNPTITAWFIEAQLKVAEALRENPKADLAPIFDVTLEDCWKGRHFIARRSGTHFGYENQRLYWMERTLVADASLYRGFHEHVAMKAKYFLQFAEELFSIAPIRYLTLTYCDDYLAELAASPYLSRIRGLKFPRQVPGERYMILNQFNDEGLRTLLRSPYLRDLRILEFDDAMRLTVRAFDAIAMSPNVPNLSHCSYNGWHWYQQTEDPDAATWQRRSTGRPTEEWTAELEARHGYLPWLHPLDHYGTLDPDCEAVVCHPVGDATFRPDVAARRRPRLAPELIAALQERLVEHKLRETSLVTALTGSTPGRVVATLEHAEPHPELASLATLVRLTFQQTPPFPLWDHAAQRNAIAAPRTTVTLVVPHP